MEKKNKIKFGLQDVHYAIVTETETDGVIKSTYTKPKAWPGAVSASFDPEGEDSPFYADNTVYAMTSSNSGYSAELEVARIPEEIDTDVLGQTKTTDGVVIETNTDQKKYIALMFSIEGDVKQRRMLFYRCFLTRPNIEAKTKEDGVEAATDNVSLTVTPRPDLTTINGEEKHMIKAYTSESIDADLYKNWYEKVYEPNAGAEG